ncbi:hypothetical protein GH865_02165 [Rhodocyclus tenuis]|uniref:hypothetical protein n=1 Tax=Rhodocyclus gracilis TaxID=2929842 RepID=UPI001298DC3B|nr:hypothetical protein [Rhodocyclus gracilis]MRD72057.1 hypothetical protein [Rhodocyclus gracilis]
MTPDLKEKYDHQEQELYAAIGKACVDFEHVCHALRTAILQMLQAHGLVNQKVSQVMMAELTAQPLLSIYQALIAETLVLTEIEKRICDQLCKQVKGLIERRNGIIHATWFVGWAGCDDTDFSEASGHKWKRGKSGSIIRGEKQEAKDFLLFAEECLETANHVMFLPVIPLLGDHKIERNYCINSEGKVARLPSDDSEKPSSS